MSVFYTSCKIILWLLTYGKAHLENIGTGLQNPLDIQSSELHFFLNRIQFSSCDELVLCSINLVSLKRIKKSIGFLMIHQLSATKLL